MTNNNIKKVIAAVVGAYLISLFSILPLIFLDGRISKFAEFSLTGLAAFGPSLSALLSTCIFDGTNGLKKLLGSIAVGKWPFHVIVLIIIMPALFMTSSGWINKLLFGGIVPVVMFPDTFITVITSPLGEEFCWRGIVTPNLLKKYSPLVTSIILGTIWAFWHSWQFLIPGQFKIGIPMALFLLGCISETMIYTWLFTKTNGSILSGIMFHMIYNMTYHITPIKPQYFNGSLGPIVIMTVIEFITGLLLSVKFTNTKNINKIGELI